MSEGNTTRNIIALFVARSLAAVGSVATVVIISRAGGYSFLGNYVLLTATLSILVMIANFGMDIFVTRLVAQNSESFDRSRLSIALWLQMIVAITLIGIVFLVVISFKVSHSQPWIFYSFTLIPATVSATSSAVLKGKQKMGYLAIIQLVEMIVQISGVYLLLHLGLYAVILVILAAKCIGSILHLFFLNREGIYLQIFFFSGKQGLLKTTMKEGWVLSLSVLFNTISTRGIVVMLGMLVGTYELGLFGASNKVVEVLKMIPAAIYGSLFPVMVDRRFGYKSVKRQTIQIAIITIVLVILFYLIVPKISLLLFDDFEVISYLQILLIGMIPFSVRQYLSFQMFAQNKDRQLITVNGFTTLLMISLCFFGWMYFGLEGFCWAINIVWMLECVVLWWRIQSFFSRLLK